MKTARSVPLVGGGWRGLNRTHSITLRGVRALLSQIFAKSEAGDGIDYADLTDEKLAWRKNWVTETEFRNGLADAPVRGGTGIAAATMAGFAGAIQFTKDANGSYAYKQTTMQATILHTISVWVQMDDGLAPSFAAPDVAGALNDFVLVLKGDALSTLAYAVAPHPTLANVYRVSCQYTPTVTQVGNIGIVKYGGNSTRNFRATGYMVQRGALSAYQAITDVATEFLAAWPLHSLFQDHVGNVPVWSIEQPIGMALDMRLRGFRDVEMNPDVGMNTPASWTMSGTAPLWSVANGVGSVTATSTGNRWLAAVGAGATLQTGKWYEVYADVVCSAGGVLPDMSANYAVFATTSGRKHWILQATSTAQLQFMANGAFIGSIDNVSFREVPGMHALMATANDRPALDGRFNRLVYSEVLTNAAWQKAAGVTVADNTDVGPDGVMLSTVTGVAATTCYLQQAANIPCPTNTSATMSAFVKQGTAPTTLLRVYNSGISTQLAGVIVNWNAGVASIGSTLGTWTAGPIVEATTVAGVYRVSGDFSTGAQTALAMLVYPNASNTVDTSKVGGVQITIGAAPRRYQRINAATDYDALGWPKGARFNGSNSGMQVAGLNLSSSDKISAAVSFRKDFDPTTAVDVVLVELGTIYTSAGRFVLASSVNGTANAGYYVRGSTGNTGSQVEIKPGAMAVLSGAVDWDATTANRYIRLNGANAGGSPIVGSGAVGGTTQSGDNQVLYIGRRAGTGTSFNGVIYRVAIRTTAYENFLAMVDRWCMEPIRSLIA